MPIEWLIPPFAILLLHGGAIGFGLCVRRSGRRRLLARVRGSLVLTYDDGPGASLEPRLLELLDRHSARATFFLLGERAEARPHRAQALRDAGHEIASHGSAHVHAWKCTPWRPVLDLRRGDRQLAPWRSEPRVFRPPYGKLTLWTWLELRRSRTRLSYWTHVSGDTYPRERRSVAGVVGAVEATGGGIVLLHSFDRTDRPDAEDYVLAVTEGLLDAARRHGWRVRTVSETMGAVPPAPAEV